MLAMQVLGGDPQSAYLLGLAAAGYALGLARSRGSFCAAGPKTAGEAPPGRSILAALASIAVVLLWAAATVAMGVLLPKLRAQEPGPSTPPLAWVPWMPMGIAAAWGAAGLGFLYFYCWRKRGWRRPLGAMWLGLAASAVLATGITAAQLLPVVEFIALTTRAAATGTNGIYAFSIEPYRLSELVWPNIGGVQFNENSYWPDAIPIPGVYPRMWIPSLYLGGLTFILASVTLSFRHAPPWRVWLSWIAVISSLGALGQYTSPIWAARTAVALSHSPRLERIAAELGPLGTPGEAPIRQDGFLKDGDGSIYWWMATFLPGFRQFRFPGKLFCLTSFALAALAGIGWDSVCAGRTWRAKVVMILLIGLGLGILAAVIIERAPILAPV